MCRPARRKEQLSVLALQPGKRASLKATMALRPSALRHPGNEWELRRLSRSCGSGLPVPRRDLGAPLVLDRKDTLSHQLLQDPKQRARFRLVAEHLADLVIVEDLEKPRQYSLDVGGATRRVPSPRTAGARPTLRCPPPVLPCLPGDPGGPPQSCAGNGDRFRAGSRTSPPRT